MQKQYTKAPAVGSTRQPGPRIFFFPSTSNFLSGPPPHNFKDPKERERTHRTSGVGWKIAVEVPCGPGTTYNNMSGRTDLIILVCKQQLHLLVYSAEVGMPRGGKHTETSKFVDIFGVKALIWAFCRYPHRFYFSMLQVVQANVHSLALQVCPSEVSRCPGKTTYSALTSNMGSSF